MTAGGVLESGGYIGLDVGYGFVKVTDGDSGYAFPSVRRIQAAFATGYHSSEVADLRIGIDGKAYCRW